MGTNSYTTQDFIAKIPGSGGIIAVIAKRVGCTWTTAKKYCTQYATVRQAYEDESEAVADLAESTVLKAIQGGDIPSAKWWLSRIRRDKFATRQETDVTSDGKGLTVEFKGNIEPDAL